MTHPKTYIMLEIWSNKAGNRGIQFQPSLTDSGLALKGILGISTT